MQKNNVGDWAWAIYTKIRGIVQKNQIKSLENKVKGTDFHGYISKTDLGYVSGQGYEYIPSHNHAKAFCRYTPGRVSYSLADTIFRADVASI